MKSIAELQSLFANSLENQEKDREYLIKSRIQAFFDRQREVRVDEDSPKSERNGRIVRMK